MVLIHLHSATFFLKALPSQFFANYFLGNAKTCIGLKYKCYGHPLRSCLIMQLLVCLMQAR